MPVSFTIGVQPSRYTSETGYAAGIQSQMAAIEGVYEQLFASVQGATPEIIFNALLPTKSLAEYYTPVKTGALRASSYLEVTTRGDMPRVELGFAKGGSPGYGVYVHEMVGYSHASPTRSKFLQAAVLEDLERVRTRIINAYKSLTGL